MPTWTPEQFAVAMDRLGADFGTRDLQPALEACRRPIQQGIRRNFELSQSSAGESWPPRAVPLGIVRYNDQPFEHPLLVETGALMTAATGGHSASIDRIEGNALTLGVDKSASKDGGIPGAAVHQGGYTELHIPARPYLGISEEALRKCVAAIEPHAAAAAQNILENG